MSGPTFVSWHWRVGVSGALRRLCGVFLWRFQNGGEWANEGQEGVDGEVLSIWGVEGM